MSVNQTKRTQYWWISGFVVVASLLLAGYAGLFTTADPEELFTTDQYANPDALVDTAWVQQHLNDEQVRLIDVSSSADVFAEGHLPGAQYINIFDDLTNADDPVRGQILSADALSTLLSDLGVSNEHTIVFYDDKNNLLAARAYWVLKYYQHDDVRIYDGGSQKWLADDLELTSSEAAFGNADATYVAGAPDPAIRTTWQDVVDGIDDPATLFCDTRSLGEHTGIDARSEQGGHIPGSLHVEWTQAVASDGTFLDRASLEGLYREAGFSPEQQVITYCQTGVRGAHTWFVLRELLGYPDVRNYDGSWEEYGNNPQSPLN
jgi:thiosulfate/3-mercaptopyruvate sulfurtransferase